MDTDKQNTQSESIMHTEHDRSRQFVLAQTSLAFSTTNGKNSGTTCN